MPRSYYAGSISDFLTAAPGEILGRLTQAHSFDLTPAQTAAWREEILLLKTVLGPHKGRIHFEYSIPRMGRRIDVVLLIEPVVFALEFKVGQDQVLSADLDQVMDYALDLKNFHEGSHRAVVAPILIPTQAPKQREQAPRSAKGDGLLDPLVADAAGLGEALERVLRFAGEAALDVAGWESSGYRPTPTIVEAALALYAGHHVREISRNEAANLGETSDAVADIIRDMRASRRKAVCFVTGVPGAGKTLVGLNIATTHFDRRDEQYSVFLSGNGPLVSVLQEALARDKILRLREKGGGITKSRALSESKAFIQNVHHFRDECLIDPKKVPLEHVTIFDEAQRAWDLPMTVDFMKRKKGIADFKQSEPEFLISCMDRHPDWAVIVCLVGGGQEINRGEAGIREWLRSLARSFSRWRVFISDPLTDSEHGAATALRELDDRKLVTRCRQLHLATSVRAFRAEKVSSLVKRLLDLERDEARALVREMRGRYPLALTRDPRTARTWLRRQARGTERYGLVVSSQAERLKPHAIDVKSPMNPIHWFLGAKDDVRSSYYLEDVATEFHIQGLELDWAGVVWDADFRYAKDGWEHWSFRGNRWERIRKEERRTHLKNAYRVLLTRARQGMIIVVPEGEAEDPTRDPGYYGPTFEYLKGIGVEVV